MVKSVDFTELLRTQQKLQASMGWPEGFEVVGFRTSILALIVEATEALDEVPWKPWKPDNYKDVNQDALATEMTDILQFWANACIHMGLTPEMLSNALRAKWVINNERRNNGETKSV